MASFFSYNWDIPQLLPTYSIQRILMWWSKSQKLEIWTYPHYTEGWAMHKLGEMTQERQTIQTRIELCTELHKLSHDSLHNGWAIAHIDDINSDSKQTVWWTAGDNINHAAIICHLCYIFSNLHRKIFYDCASDFWMWLIFTVYDINYTITTRKVIISCEKRKY